MHGELELVFFPVSRYPHIAKDHLVRLLKQLMLRSPRPSLGIGTGPNAADVPTLLGTDSFSLLSCMVA